MNSKRQLPNLKNFRSLQPSPTKFTLKMKTEVGEQKNLKIQSIYEDGFAGYVLKKQQEMESQMSIKLTMRTHKTHRSMLSLPQVLEKFESPRMVDSISNARYLLDEKEHEILSNKRLSLRNLEGRSSQKNLDLKLVQSNLDLQKFQIKPIKSYRFTPNRKPFGDAL